MPRGGRRVGSGRKPKMKEPAVLIGFDGQRIDTSAPAQSHPAAPPAFDREQAPPTPTTELGVPPKDLRADAKKVWLKLAPFAISQGTLIASTVGGFRQLCKALALADTLFKSIHRKGAGTKDAESSLRLYVRLDQRVDAMMGRFKLTAFGKPADPGFIGSAGTNKPAPTPPVNPWSRVVAK